MVYLGIFLISHNSHESLDCIFSIFTLIFGPGTVPDSWPAYIKIFFCVLFFTCYGIFIFLFLFQFGFTCVIESFIWYGVWVFCEIMWFIYMMLSVKFVYQFPF